MDITQTFYNNLAPHYDKLFSDWNAESREQADILKQIFENHGFDTTANILDCACGIGTQSIGLSRLGYRVTASDISDAEIAEANRRAADMNLKIRFKNADFRHLSEVFTETFDIVIAMDNALPHMLSSTELETAIKSIVNRIKPNGIFVGSIRDYDTILENKPSYSPPYIHKTENGQRISFQTWDWNDDIYKFTQYIIVDNESVSVNKFNCEYRATRREEMTNIFLSCGCQNVTWLFPNETKFYQPIVVAMK